MAKPLRRLTIYFNPDYLAGQMDWEAVDRGEAHIRAKILECCAAAKQMSRDHDKNNLWQNFRI